MMQTIQSQRASNPVIIPPGLAAVAQGRDHITTPEFARAMCCAVQTALKNHCLKGECYGVRPIKRGKLLLWPVAQVAQSLSGAV
jgi:hypothetical protein